MTRTVMPPKWEFFSGMAMGDGALEVDLSSAWGDLETVDAHGRV